MIAFIILIIVIVILERQAEIDFDKTLTKWQHLFALIIFIMICNFVELLSKSCGESDLSILIASGAGIVLFIIFEIIYWLARLITINK